MNVFQSLMHYGSYAMAFYAFYVVLGSMAFGFYVWRRVFQHSGNGKGKGKGPMVDASYRSTR